MHRGGGASATTSRTPRIFTPSFGGIFIACRFFSLLFSYSCELLFPQALYFDNHPRCPRVSPSEAFPTLRSLCLFVKFIFFSRLRTLDLSCHSFSVSRPLFSRSCALFSKNTRGVGIPGRFCSATSASDGSFSHSSDEPNRPEEICMRTRNIMIRTILVSLELPAHVRH
jgi:hypothetical protein